MRVLVCGGRDFCNDRLLYRSLHALHALYGVTLLIEGGARGADRLAREWAVKTGVEVKTYPADWDKHGRSAGPIRNEKMLLDGKPELVIAFPGGKGTAHMVALAEKAGVQVKTVRP